jgi:hypothetical protein
MFDWPVDGGDWCRRPSAFQKGQQKKDIPERQEEKGAGKGVEPEKKRSKEKEKKTRKGDADSFVLLAAAAER